jgi:ParB family transcriptional regulator, chromosome partitioning protein
MSPAFGVAVHADDFLPCMASEEFLACLSRPALDAAARACGLVPHKKARDTRAAIRSQVRNGTFVHPSARFALTEAERTAMAGHEPHAPAWLQGDGDAPDTADDPADPGEEDT